jgi:acetyl-CoA carboxylase carboxyltransferase component
MYPAMVATTRPAGARVASCHLIEVPPGRHQFLAGVFDGFDAGRVRVWIEADVTETTYDRQCNGGLVTLLVGGPSGEVAVVWSDFRVNGASYGRATSSRLTSFLRHLRGRSDGVPLVYVVNSAGVSIMEGRTAFSSAFGIWPELLRYSEDHVVLTCAVGKCLGLAPLLYGLGHYRVAVAGTQVNLTGPDVLRMFFGRGGLGFEERAAAERCAERTELIHEIVPSLEAGLRLFRNLLLRTGQPTGSGITPPLGVRTRRILERILDGQPQEVVPGWCPRVRLFIGRRRGRPVGVFVNPLERVDNLISVRTLDKYAAGLDLFRALGLPMISVLDTPGIDPRFDEGDANNIRRILHVGEKIIHYPHGSMGVVAGRCYGGASTLAFPKIFGGRRALALRDAQIGVMDDRIVSQVLKASPRLLAQWREAAAARGTGFDDLLAEGTLDAVIEAGELSGEVDRFLATCGRPGSAAQLRLVAGGARGGYPTAHPGEAP